MLPLTMLRRLLLALISTLAVTVVTGQADLQPGFSSQAWEVFLRHDAAAPSETLVLFVDLLTGATTSAATSGERHTLIGDAVIYFDSEQRQVKLVKQDGIIRDHPYISLREADEHIDWAVADAGDLIAFATASSADEDQMTTRLMLADAAGMEARELLVYGPKPGIRLIPIAFSSDNETLYVEVHAQGTAEASAYQQRSGVFALDLNTEHIRTRALPGDQTCFCAVGFGRDVMLRLVSREDSPGLALEIYDLRDGSLRTAPPVALGSYDQAGNILVSPDGALAVYALSQVSGWASADKAINSVIVVADLEAARQMVVNFPMSALARPLEWTEDNSAILLTQTGISGAWKMQVDNGATVMVADGVYLGRIGEVADN